jgi:uncharacterized protein (DUF934 family)
MALIKHDSVVPDPWLCLPDDEPLPDGDARVIVSTARWQEIRDASAIATRRIGIRLEPGEFPERIADDLARFAVVAVRFASFRDGRGFSSARMLRERYAYSHEIRATGEVTVDQAMFLRRCGFDAIEVPDNQDPESWLSAFQRYSVRYQTATDDGPLAWFLRRKRIVA